MSINPSTAAISAAHQKTHTQHPNLRPGGMHTDAHARRRARWQMHVHTQRQREAAAVAFNVDRWQIKKTY